ncbi:MAG TPA: hypothetical protein PKC30_05315 [Saprospiraceae bacterium]|nr:hypothetical protein [Saprospiraceae bacterium]
MARPSTKKFEFGKGIYYFNIKSGYNNTITIKRVDRQLAIDAFKQYVRNYHDCEWLGKWDGKKFVEEDFNALAVSQ